MSTWPVKQVNKQYKCLAVSEKLLVPLATTFQTVTFIWPHVYRHWQKRIKLPGAFFVIFKYWLSPPISPFINDSTCNTPTCAWAELILPLLCCSRFVIWYHIKLRRYLIAILKPSLCSMRVVKFSTIYFGNFLLDYWLNYKK